MPAKNSESKAANDLGDRLLNEAATQPNCEVVWLGVLADRRLNGVASQPNCEGGRVVSSTVSGLGALAKAGERPSASKAHAREELCEKGEQTIWGTAS